MIVAFRVAFHARCYRDQRNVNAAKGLAKDTFLVDLIIFVNHALSAQELGQLRKCVWEAVGEEYFIPFLRFVEIKVEGKHAVVYDTCWVLRGPTNDVRFAIVDVLATLGPLIVLTFSRDANSHARRIERHWFRKVDDTEPYCRVRHAWRHDYRKVEPLVMAACIRIGTHVKVIVHRLRFNDHVEVTTFEC